MGYHAVHKIMIDKSLLILGDTVDTGLSWTLWRSSKAGHTHLPCGLPLIDSEMAENSEWDGHRVLHKDTGTHSAQVPQKAGRTSPTYS